MANVLIVEEAYRLCYVRGPEGIILGLAGTARKAALASTPGWLLPSVSRYSVSDISGDNRRVPGAETPPRRSRPRNDRLAGGRRPQPGPGTGSIGP